MGWTTGIRFPEGAEKGFFLCATSSRPYQGALSLLSNVYRGLVPRD